MGGNPSKKIEETLETSPAFRAAVDESYEECMRLTQWRMPGLQAYQLLDAVKRVYEKLSVVKEEDAVSKYKEKSLPQAPSQGDVDRIIRRENLFQEGLGVLDLEDFRAFASTLFRDMGLSTACHRLAVYVPASGIGVLATHLVVKRLPGVGPLYSAGSPYFPVLLLGSVLGVVVSCVNPA